MLRFFTMGKRLGDLSRAAYHQGLLEGHAPLVQACAGFRRHCTAYTQNHVQGALDLSTGAIGEPSDALFDNCSEFWYEGVQSLLLAYHNDDYVRMLRPDENRWSDPQARIAFLAREIRIWDPFPSRAVASAVKILVLRGKSEGARFSRELNAEHAIGDLHPDFFERCLRYVENEVTGVMDFKNARIAEQNTLPYSHLSELWFASREEASAAFHSADGRELLLSARFPFCDATASSTTALWALEHPIF